MNYTIRGGVTKDIAVGDMVRVPDGILPRSVEIGEFIPVVGTPGGNMVLVSLIPDGSENFNPTNLSSEAITEVWRKQ